MAFMLSFRNLVKLTVQQLKRRNVESWKDRCGGGGGWKGVKHRIYKEDGLKDHRQFSTTNAVLPMTTRC